MDVLNEQEQQLYNSLKSENKMANFRQALIQDGSNTLNTRLSVSKPNLVPLRGRFDLTFTREKYFLLFIVRMHIKK